LYTAIIGGFLISLLGGSRVQIGGPTGAFMIIVFGIVTEYGLSGLMVATLMAGLIMIAMGLLRWGNLIKYIPFPITTGFTTGIAVVIFTSQLKDLFGLKFAEAPVGFIAQGQTLLTHIPSFDPSTLGIGLLALTIILIWPKVSNKIPGTLIALVVTAFLVNWFDMPVETIGSRFGEMSVALPSLQPVILNLEIIKKMLGPAISIAVLGSVESLLSAVVADGLIGGKHRSNMELVAQGVANIASALFGGIPATGAIARTVANIRSGGRTPVAGIVHAVTLLIILMLFMPLAQSIPLSALSAILMVVAYNMGEWRECLFIFKAPKSDVLVLLVTFSLTVLFDLVIAIEVGMVLAAFLFMNRMAQVSGARELMLDAAEEQDDEIHELPAEYTSEQAAGLYQIYEINGPFFFGAADQFVEVFSGVRKSARVLIIRMRNVPTMDATALYAMRNVVRRVNSMGMQLMITGINPQPYKIFEQGGLVNLIGKDFFFPTLSEAVAQIMEKQDTAI
jgi:SulP family sulfate permease